MRCQVELVHTVDQLFQCLRNWFDVRAKAAVLFQWGADRTDRL